MLYLPGSIFKIIYTLTNTSVHVMLTWIGHDEYRLVCLDDATIYSNRSLTGSEDENWQGFTLAELEAYVQIGTRFKVEVTYVKDMKDVRI